MKILEADKIGSATSPLNLTKKTAVIDENNSPKAGDVVAGSVTDSQTGEDFVERTYNPAAMPDATESDCLN